MGSVPRHLLDAALVSMLATVTGKQVGLSRIVGDPATLPYAIVYPLPSGRGSGSFAHPEEDRDYQYQVTCVGEDPKQASWMSQQVQEAMTSRGFFGSYTNEISAAGVNIMDRLCDAVGGARSQGETLFVSDDTYTVRTTA